MSEEPDDFKGIWVDASLISDTRLTLSEKLLLAFTRSFKKRCYAGDAHIAKRLGISPKTVANCLTSLRKRGIIKGRDFPNPGTQLPENGNKTSRKREHRSQTELSKNERENADRVFSYENPEEVRGLVCLLAARGLGEDLARRAVDEVVAEVKGGFGDAPRNWLVYCHNRAKKLRADAARLARAKGGAPSPNPAAPANNFSRNYTITEEERRKMEEQYAREAAANGCPVPRKIA